MRYEAVVIGVSAGGFDALKTILPALPAHFPLPIAIVQHRNERGDSFLADYLDGICELTVKEAEDKEPVTAGNIYIAPSGYHLLVEATREFSLSVDARVNFACPSIDVLFESASDVFAEKLIGIILTGANSDGARGLSRIRERGGCAIVQNPETALVATMPKAALTITTVDHIVTLSQLAPLLLRLSQPQEAPNVSSG